MEPENTQEIKSSIQRISNAIIAIFFLYVFSSIVLWAMSKGLEHNHVMFRETTTGLGYCLIDDETARTLIDFYNTYNLPWMVYFRLMGYGPLITIFVSLISISILIRMQSVTSRPKANIEPAFQMQTLKTQKDKTTQISPEKLERLRRDFTDLIILDLEGHNRNELFSGIAKFALNKGLVKNEEFLYDSLLEGESRGTSAIGNGIALPEAAIVEMTRPYAFILCRTKQPVDFGSLDRIPVRILLVALKSEQINFSDLKPMSRILQLLKSDESKNKIMDAKTEDDIYKLWEETVL